MAIAASFGAWVARLPQATHQVLGRRTNVRSLPDNIVCFQRCSAEELNKPRHGRALHHRCVLALALETAVTVCVDDHQIRLHPGEGLLLLPFQFHHYIEPAAEEMCWFFATFDLANTEPLERLRYRPFKLTPTVQSLAAELAAAYLQEGGESELLALLLALLLARVCREEIPAGAPATPTIAPGMVMQVNQLVHKHAVPLGIKEIAAALGISQSHLRTRFRASCGVSLGKHLRRLRLEKACGLLRLTPARVSEVAEQCGFNSIYHFSRAFHSAYGVSPMAYRHGEAVVERPSPRRPGGNSGRSVAAA